MLHRRLVPTFARTAGEPSATARPRGPRAAVLSALAAAALAPLMSSATGLGAQAAPAGVPPATIPLATAPVDGWSAWSPVAGPSFLSPSVAFNPAAGAVELA